MKKIITIALALTVSTSYAQGISDVFRALKNSETVNLAVSAAKEVYHKTCEIAVEQIDLADETTVTMKEFFNSDEFKTIRNEVKADFLSQGMSERDAEYHTKLYVAQNGALLATSYYAALNVKKYNPDYKPAEPEVTNEEPVKVTVNPDLMKIKIGLNGNTVEEDEPAPAPVKEKKSKKFWKKVRNYIE